MGLKKPAPSTEDQIRCQQGIEECQKHPGRDYTRAKPKDQIALDAISAIRV